MDNGQLNWRDAAAKLPEMSEGSDGSGLSPFPEGEGADTLEEAS